VVLSLIPYFKTFAWEGDLPPILVSRDCRRLIRTLSFRCDDAEGSPSCAFVILGPLNVILSEAKDLFVAPAGKRSIGCGLRMTA
jgi:hypothetical protein